MHNILILKKLFININWNLSSLFWRNLASPRNLSII